MAFRRSWTLRVGLRRESFATSLPKIMQVSDRGLWIFMVMLLAYDRNTF